MNPERRRERLDRWIDRQPDPHPDDSWAEIASAAKAAVSATAALLYQRKAYPSRTYVNVPWDGAGGEYRAYLHTRPNGTIGASVDGRDEWYLGKEYALALERFVERVLEGAP